MLRRAFEKRERLRKKGRRAYLRGIVAAVIDNCHEEYMKETNEIAKKVVNVTETLIKEPDINPKAMEGTKEILLVASDSFKDKATTVNDNPINQALLEKLDVD